MARASGPTPPVFCSPARTYPSASGISRSFRAGRIQTSPGRWSAVRDNLRIRPLESGDLEAVANHYERLFRNGAGSASPGLIDAMRGLFVDAPVRATDVQ